MKKILILGGTRYLGKSIVNKLSLKDKFEIASLSRSKENSIIQHFICDRKKTDDLKKVFKDFKPNIIIDMLNFSHKDSESIKYLYEKKTLPYLNHYIMISTFFLYNYFDHAFFSEREINTNYDSNEMDEYTKCKIESELTLYSSNIMDITTILRLPFIFSDDDYTKRFQKICKISLNVNASNFDNTRRYSLIQKDDAANAIISLLNMRPIGITDLSNKGCVTDKEIIEFLSKNFTTKINFKDNLNKKLPYTVRQNICLDSKKLKIQTPIFSAIKKESEKYFSSLNDPKIIQNTMERKK